MLRAHRVLWVGAGVVVAGCHDAPTASRQVTGPSTVPPSSVNGVTAAVNPFNVLSTIVTFPASTADSARVVYTAIGGGDSGATPTQALHGAAGRIVTLGLLQRTSYRQVLQRFNPGGAMTADTVGFTTTAVPGAIGRARLTILSGQPGSGYYLVSPIEPVSDTSIIVAFDSAARVRWYRIFPGWHAQAESKQQLNGHFTINVARGTASQGAGLRYIEFLPSGDSIATYEAAAVAPSGTDEHELWLTGDTASPTVHLLGVDDRTGNLTSKGGPASGLLEGHLMLRQTASGTVLFSWNAWDHYSIADWIEPTGVNPPNDFDHPNSIDFDLDSNYIISFRHMGAVIKLDRTTGAILWQLGGRLNQFTIADDPLMFFTGQHSVRVLENGNLLMYDNGLRHTPQHTRAVEYQLDVAAKTATMVWEYEPSPAVFTPIVGSVQRYTSGPRAGNTLVAFAYVGQIDEVNPAEQLVWRGQFSLGGNNEAYRVLRLVSFYQYEKP
jgi:Arylsulfotransferase (ASST)